MPEFTERQKAAWPEAIADLRSRTEQHIPEGLWNWQIRYHEETRPGRGHAFDAVYLDGEIVAGIHMDVYGYPRIEIGWTTWIHASSDYCTCDRCVAEQEAED